MSGPRDLVRNAGFREVDRDGDLYLFHPVEGTLIRKDAHVAAALRAPASDTTVLERLRLLLPTAAAELLSRGVAHRSTTPLGPSWHRQPPAAGWVSVGWPVSWHSRALADPATGVGVVREVLAGRTSGPGSSYWSWGAERRVSREELIVADYGDLVHDPGVDSISDAHERLLFAVGQIVAAGNRPLVLGGDHAVGHATIRAVLERHPGTRLVHLDAHADRAPLSVDGPPHCGNFLTHLLADLPDLRVLTIGVRGTDSGFPEEPGDRVSYVQASDVGTETAVGRIREFVEGHPVHLTIDADVIDPSQAPEVAYPVPGGPTAAQVAALVRLVTARGQLVGADLSEVCRVSPSANHAAACLGLLATEILEGQCDR